MIHSAENNISLEGWDISLTTDTPEPSIKILNQKHTGIVIPVSEYSAEKEADGFIIEKQDGPIGIRTADCAPVVFIGKTKAAALHVSRISLLEHILEQTKKQLGENSVAAYIGPHICGHCFTFSYEGEKVAQLSDMYPEAVKKRDGITHISLSDILLKKFQELGIPENRITSDTRCTFETPTLPSYKRWLLGGKQGTLAHITTQVQFRTAA